VVVGIQITPRALHQARAHDPPPPHGILAAIRLGLSNGRLKGLNSRIRLISHRFGLHSATPLIALVYLRRAGIVIPLPR
jgi:hypothetical protein